MQTNAILVSLLASGFAAAAPNSYPKAADCTPSVVAYTTPAYTPPATPSIQVSDYGSPSAPYESPKQTSWSHATSTVTDFGHPYSHTDTGYNTATSTTKTSNPPKGTPITPVGIPTYRPVQSVANRSDAQCVFIATVVAGLFFFM